LGNQTRKIRLLCEDQLGFGTAKAVIASKGCDGACSTLLAPSQELATRA
jgi:hypothetical protein